MFRAFEQSLHVFGEDDNMKVKNRVYIWGRRLLQFFSFVTVGTPSRVVVAWVWHTVGRTEFLDFLEWVTIQIHSHSGVRIPKFQWVSECRKIGRMGETLRPTVSQAVLGALVKELISCVFRSCIMSTGCRVSGLVQVGDRRVLIPSVTVCWSVWSHRRSPLGYLLSSSPLCSAQLGSVILVCAAVGGKWVRVRDPSLTVSLCLGFLWKKSTMTKRSMTLENP